MMMMMMMIEIGPFSHSSHNHNISEKSERKKEKGSNVSIWFFFFFEGDVRVVGVNAEIGPRQILVGFVRLVLDKLYDYGRTLASMQTANHPHMAGHPLSLFIVPYTKNIIFN